MSAPLTDIQAIELLDLICGPLLGEGTYRKVFESKYARSKEVIKLDNMGNFSNVLEWDTWNELKDTSIGKWLAPCYAISDHGVWLVQARTIPMREGEFPKRVPAIFADIKRANWGLYEGRPVCHD